MHKFATIAKNEGQYSKAYSQVQDFVIYLETAEEEA